MGVLPFPHSCMVIFVEHPDLKGMMTGNGNRHLLRRSHDLEAMFYEASNSGSAIPFVCVAVTLSRMVTTGPCQRRRPGSAAF